MKVLQDENKRLKSHVQSLVDEMTSLENERGGTLLDKSTGKSCVNV